MPKSALGEWARAWWHTRGGAGGLGWECIYKCSLQSKFHSILTSGLVPRALFSSPPSPHPHAPAGPCPSGVLSLCHFVILAQTLSTGEQHFLPLFPLSVGPLAPSQKHSRAFSILPGLGVARQAGGGPAGPPYCSPGPPPDVSHPCPADQPWPHNGATSKFSHLAVSFQGALLPSSGSPSTPLVGVGILNVRISIAGLFRGNHVAIFS